MKHDADYYEAQALDQLDRASEAIMNETQHRRYALAQVYATLALAASTEESANAVGSIADNGLPRGTR